VSADRSRLPTLDERLAAASGKLTPSERDVVSYVSEHRAEVAFLSAAEIAAALGVSDATVVRATQALGYRGLSQLKHELREEVQQRASPALRYRRSLEALGGEDGLLERLITDQVDLLTAVAGSVPAAELQRAVEVVADAERTFVAGFGPLGFVAEYCALSLRRVGRTTTPVTGRSFALADELVQIRKGDAVVLLAYERLVADHEAVLDRAAGRSVPCVLITDHLALATAGRYEAALSAARGATDMMPSATVPLVLVEALTLGVVSRDRQRALAALDELNRLREQLEAD
jgi:DNA-binding MurR/RpiR family transcriptional regulator